MYRRELNTVMVLVGLTGLLLVAGAPSRTVSWPGLALLVWLFVTNAWIVVKDRIAIRRSRQQGRAVLVPMRAGWLSRAFVLRHSGLKHPGGPATEYHVRPRSGRGAGVLRRAMADLDRIAEDALSPSLHLFAWRGMRRDRLERLLHPFLRSGDKLATWQHGDVAFGVVIREGRND